MAETAANSPGNRSVAIGGNVRGSTIFTGEVVIEHLTLGLRQLPTDYAARLTCLLPKG